MATKDKKEHYILPIIIGFFIVGVFGSLFMVTMKDINNSVNKSVYLNNIIESSSKKDGKNAYLKIKSISPKFAEGKKSSGYYFVSDGKYNYVVLLDNKTAKKLIDEDLESKPITIEGVTRETPDILKEIALEEYNSGYEEHEKISVKDYYSYFGDIYLDQTIALK